MGIIILQPVFAADVITNQNFLKVIQQSDRYQDVAVKISGKIVNQVQGDSVNSYSVAVGGIENEKLRYMFLWDDRADRPTLENNGCYIVEGYWDGRMFPLEGLEMEMPLVWLTVYTEIECLPAEFPATASGKHQGSDWKQELINPNMGCVSADPDIQCALSWPIISLESVELTSDHMRAFFTIDNVVGGSFGEVRQYEWDHIVVQDRKQFEVLHAHSSINTLGNIIPVGIIEDGWLLFEPIEPKPFEMRIVLKSFTTFDEYTLVFNVDDFNIVSTSMPAFTSSSPEPAPDPEPVAEPAPEPVAESAPEPVAETVTEPTQKSSTECDKDYTFVDGMCTKQKDERKLGDKLNWNFSDALDRNPKLSVQVKLIDPSGKIIQDRFVASHGKLAIEFPETGMVGDYQLIWQYHSGSKVIWQVRHIIPIVGEEQQSSVGCGAGTVMVNGVCQLTQTSGTSTRIEPIYIVIAAVAVGGGAVGALFALKRGSGTPKPAREEIEEYESEYVARKPAEKKETSSSCSNCGAPFKKPDAKFCGECGTPRS